MDSPLSPAMPLKQETLAEGDKTVAALMGEWRAVAHLHSLPWNIAAGLSLTIKLEVSITANYTIQMIHRDLKYLCLQVELNKERSMAKLGKLIIFMAVSSVALNLHRNIEKIIKI